MREVRNKREERKVGLSKRAIEEIKKVARRVWGEKMPKFQIENSQSGAPDGEPFEAESLEEAQRIVLEWNGITIKEVKKE